jgi:N-acetylglucosaminyl-diphospho-decaprenol L-rhamnosyltransferase
VIYFITVNYYSVPFIEKLLQSFDKSEESLFTFIIVNNSPDDELIDTFSGRNLQVLNTQENLGFGQACNIGLNWVYQQDPQAIVWLINPDAYLLTPSVQKASQFFQKYPEISILGTTIWEPNGKISFGQGQFNPGKGTIIASEILPTELSKPYLPAEWVSGCSLLINLQKFTECPQFDPDFFLYYEDFDFCRRYAKQGHFIALTNQLQVIHAASSITSRFQDLKIQQSIYSYLLALEKNTSSVVLFSRLLKITGSSLISLPFHPVMALNKLKGVVKYCKRMLRS